MSTLKATYLQQASSASPNITLDASTNATVAGTLAMGSSFKRNRIINGDMVVDQRNAGASVTLNDAIFPVDRFRGTANITGKCTAQQSTTAPANFINSLLITSSSAYTLASTDILTLAQIIEGYNIADFAWGTADAKTITLSFWVRSSLTGTFGGVIRNSAGNRSYAFTYSISTANTWTSISIPIPGDTSGTWLTTNGAGLFLFFSLGVGTTYTAPSGGNNTWASANYQAAYGTVNLVNTNGATFYITGVQLEVGSVATPYERQIYSDQLAQCQRYYQLVYATIRLQVTSGASYWTQANMLVSMRATPTATATSTYEFRANLGSVTAAAAGVNAVQLQTTATGSGDGYTTQNLITCSAEL